LKRVIERQGEIEFDWDRANIRHIARHRVRPEEAEQALRNLPFDLEYQVVGGEQRWTSLGQTDGLRILLVVWTLRADVVRVVTARSASKQLSQAYLRHKGA
jgi:uncharacterized DUF497 family protein